MKESRIEITTLGGVELEGCLIRLGRFEVVFDVFSPEVLLRTSEVLPRLKILRQGCVVYEGRATVTNLINLAGGVTCVATVEEPGVFVTPVSGAEAGWRASFSRFMEDWNTARRIAPEFKLAVTDLQLFLTNLRHWLDEVEISMAHESPGRVNESERLMVEQIRPGLIQTLASLTNRFEEVAAKVRTEERAVYERFTRERLHPLVLVAPFAHRTYAKPLGYAGDYQMMNMIMRRRGEGASLYARMVHSWLVEQPPAEAVRNRTAHLGVRLVEETLRVHHEGRRARILNIGCGPAWEVQQFIKASRLSDYADFELVDFNPETLAYVNQTLEESRRAAGRSTTFKLVEMSVYQIIKRSLARQRGIEQSYDLIYCSGLFDYMSKNVCQQLVKAFLEALLPGGLVLVANMEAERPFRYNTEYLLGWHLVFRNSQSMAELVPANFTGRSEIVVEPASVNLFLELRKD